MRRDVDSSVKSVLVAKVAQTAPILAMPFSESRCQSSEGFRLKTHETLLFILSRASLPEIR